MTQTTVRTDNEIHLFSQRVSAAKNGLFSFQWHHATCGQRGRPKSNHGETMAEVKKICGETE